MVVFCWRRDFDIADRLVYSGNADGKGGDDKPNGMFEGRVI